LGRKKPRTLLEVAVARGGLVKGPRAVSMVVGWVVAEEMLGHPPTLEEYAEWWKMSRATAFREQAAFRQCFPEETTPQRIADLVKARRDEWGRGGVKGLGALMIEGLSGGGAAA
jgi:hypothetical protein